ncbi:MAG: mechanosensitive ion channel family protein [Alphaproteobacteria bacterium]
MSVADNAGEAISAGRGSLEAVMNWFEANAAVLPVGLAVAGVIVAIMLVVRWVGSRMVASDPECRRWRGIIGRVLAKTSIFFMVATALDIVATYADVPRTLSRLTDIFFIVASAFQGAIWARELILGAIQSRVGDEPGESTLGNAMSIIRVLVSVAAFAFALVIILDNLGVNVTTLVAGLGIGGIAIGLAAQGIFSDLFAALSIVFDRPFRRGDTINYGGTVDGGGTTGTVERIGLKTTRIRSRTGELVVMANTKLLEQELTNIDEAHVYRIWLPFGVVYQTDPAKLQRMGEIVGSVLKDMKGVRFVRCAVSGFGASSIDFQLVYDDHAKDFDTRALNKSAICIGILKTFKAEGIEFAYPTQTTFTAAPDGTLVMPYAQPPSPTPQDGRSKS